MKLTSLPAFVDNYIWMLHDDRRAVVVDPGASAPVLDALERHRLELAGILVTHHHGDHVGGLVDLMPSLRGPVFGPATEPMPVPVRPVSGGDAVELLGLRFRVIDVPGHTRGHVAYWTPDVAGEPAAPVVFCGDTLFSAGCGRLFEGTAAQLHASLTALADLPGDTAVCCAHEYTLSNLRFARAVEPGNADLAAHTAWCEARRAAGLPTLPSTIATERRINPFLRCDVPEVAAAARRHTPAADSPAEILGSLRRWKDTF